MYCIMDNLVQNGDFETGSLLPFWNATGGFQLECFPPNMPPCPNFGNCDAKVDFNVAGMLSQSGILTTQGQPYRLTFNIFSQAQIPPGQFTITIDNDDPIDLFPIITSSCDYVFTTVFVPDTPTTTITLTSTLSFSDVIFFDNFSIVPIIICFSGNSIVHAKNTTTGLIDNVAAKDLIVGYHEVYNSRKRAFVPIKHIVKTGPTKRYRLIKKDSISENKPSDDFYVTSGHVIFIDGVPVKAKHIPGAKRVKVKPETVYSICTEKGGPILVNGLDVMAYNYVKWLSYIASKKSEDLLTA